MFTNKHQKPVKRLYIKHDKLENLFKVNGFKKANDLLETDISHLLTGTNSKYRPRKLNNNNNIIKTNRILSKFKKIPSPERSASPIDIEIPNDTSNKLDKSKSFISTDTSDEVFPITDINPKKSTEEQPKITKEATSNKENEIIICQKENSNPTSSFFKGVNPAPMLDSIKRDLLNGTNQPIAKPRLCSSNSKSSIKITSLSSKNTLLKNLYKCKNCKLLFIDIRLLKEHQRLICNKQKNLQLNNKGSSGEKPDSVFNCKLCKKLLTNKYSFMSHSISCSAINNL